MTPSTDLETRVQALEEQTQLLRDHLEITRLICSYGPAVDSCTADAVGEIWTEDGVYDVDTGLLDGRDAIEAMVSSDMHLGFVRGGCGHVTSPPHVEVTGDTAVATAYTMLVTSGDTEFAVSRLSANRWELVRTPSGWQTARRTNRLLNSEGAGRSLLAAAVSHTSHRP